MFVAARMTAGSDLAPTPTNLMKARRGSEIALTELPEPGPNIHNPALVSAHLHSWGPLSCGLNVL